MPVTLAAAHQAEGHAESPTTNQAPDEEDDSGDTRGELGKSINSIARGKAVSVIIDTTGDGLGDTWAIDINGDGEANLTIDGRDL